MKKNLIYILVIILACALTGTITYIVVDKHNDKTEIKDNEPSNMENENEKTEQITLSEEQLEEYLSYVPKVDYFYEGENYNAYKNPSDINNISEKIIINNGLAKIVKSNDNSSGYYEIPEENHSFEFRYSAVEIKNLIKKMYNVENLDLQNSIVNKEIKDFYFAEQFVFYYYDNYFYGSLACLECLSSHVSYVDKYSANDDELIIYEYAAHFNDNLGDNCQDPDTIEDYFKDYKYTLPYSFDNDGWCKYDMEEENKSLLESINDNYFETIKNKFTQYKHTFKKNDTGYYWYKTEVVK